VAVIADVLSVLVGPPAAPPRPRPRPSTVLDRIEVGTGLVWADVDPDKVRQGQRANHT